MNKKKVGRDFEIEAFSILKEKFDIVEWLSEKTNSSYDFRCIREGKVYYGEAKVISNGSRPYLKYCQKDADFVIAKIKGIIKFIPKSEFFDNVCIMGHPDIIIKIREDTKQILEGFRIHPRETWDDLIKNLIKSKRSEHENYIESDQG